MDLSIAGMYIQSLLVRNAPSLSSERIPNSNAQHLVRALTFLKVDEATKFEERHSRFVHAIALVPRISKETGEFSRKSRHLSGAILHSFCIFNREPQDQVGIRLQFWLRPDEMSGAGRNACDVYIHQRQCDFLQKSSF